MNYPIPSADSVHQSEAVVLDKAIYAMLMVKKNTEASIRQQGRGLDYEEETKAIEFHSSRLKILEEIIAEFEGDRNLRGECDAYVYGE